MERVIYPSGIKIYFIKKKKKKNKIILMNNKFKKYTSTWIRYYFS